MGIWQVLRLCGVPLMVARKPMDRQTGQSATINRIGTSLGSVF
jgi:hypothetical protein